MPHIVSTLSSSNRYTGYHKRETTGAQMGAPSHPERFIVVHGGANVAGALRTPDGVITHVSDDDLEFLNSVDEFKKHLKNGFLKILETEKEPDVETVSEVVSEDMEQRDESAQLDVSKGDFEEGGRAGGLAPAVVETKKSKNK